MKNPPKSTHDEEAALEISGADAVIAEAMASVEGHAPDEKKRPERDGAGNDALASLLQQKDDRVREAHERLQRLAADFDNFKKRSRKAEEDAFQRGVEQALAELLPVLDSFDRTLAFASPEASVAGGLLEGIKLIHKQMLAALEKLQIRPIEALGKPFDPRFHEAIGQLDSKDVPHMHVLKEDQRGYLFKEKLLRPARVVVARNPDNEPPKSTPEVEIEIPEGSGPIRC